MKQPCPLRRQTGYSVRNKKPVRLGNPVCCVFDAGASAQNLAALHRACQASGVRSLSWRLCHLNGGKTVASARLSQDSAHVVLHRLFGNDQSSRDFLVGETFGNEWKQLPLAACEPGVAVAP